MKFKTILVAFVAVTMFAVIPARAQVSAPLQQKEWKFEVTPYAWLVGINGDITVGQREAEIDLGFSDLVDAAEFGGSILATAQYRQYVGLLQFDFFALDTDNLDEDAPQGGRLEQDDFFVTAAFGYQLPGLLSEYSSLDLMLGIRHLTISNTLTITGVGSAEGDLDITDFVGVIRPSIWLHKRVRFNSMISLGGGDSDFTLETSPQVQIFITDNIATRIGFRRMAYWIDSENELVEFDGAFQGLMLGIGGSF